MFRADSRSTKRQQSPLWFLCKMGVNQKKKAPFCSFWLISSDTVQLITWCPQWDEIFYVWSDQYKRENNDLKFPMSVSALNMTVSGSTLTCTRSFHLISLILYIPNNFVYMCERERLGTFRAQKWRVEAQQEYYLLMNCLPLISKMLFNHLFKSLYYISPLKKEKLVSRPPKSTKINAQRKTESSHRLKHSRIRTF